MKSEVMTPDEMNVILKQTYIDYREGKINSDQYIGNVFKIVDEVREMRTKEVCDFVLTDGTVYDYPHPYTCKQVVR